MPIEFTTEEIEELKKKAGARIVDKLVADVTKDLNVALIKAEVKNRIIEVIANNMSREAGPEISDIIKQVLKSLEARLNMHLHMKLVEGIRVSFKE